VLDSRFVASRRRIRVLVWLPVLIVAGLGSRQRGLPELVVLYAGDVAWGAMFFVVFAAVFPHKPSVLPWLLALVTTELIELSQLYQAPWAVHVRATPVGALLFGRGFLVSDMVCVALGATAAALVDVALCKGSRRTRVA
jgi:hypothetical protein